MMPPEFASHPETAEHRREWGIDWRKWAGKALSRRECECLRYVAAGFKEIEIAGFMGISLFTVRFHIGNACRKLDAPNRSAAIYRAAKSSII